MNKEEIVNRLERVKECIKGHEQHGVPELWDEYSELKQEKKQLKKQLKDLPSLEVGWYKHKNNSHKEWLMYDDFKGNRFGFGITGVWSSNGCDIGYIEEYCEPATDKEVETALIKEAKKRGFKEGVKFKSVAGEHSYYTLDILKPYFDGERLYLSSCGVIFKNGKWAEIIEEPKTVTLNGKYNKIQLTDILNNQL